MDLKHSELDTLYEGSDPEKYSKFSAKNINKPYTQLLENDVALLAEAASVKLLTIANKNQNVDNDRDLSSTLPKVSALEGIVSTDERYTADNPNIPSPLNVNGFLIGGLTRGPVGYSGAGNCAVTAVSPYTKGFQGSYYGDKPSNASSTQDEATASKPFYYGSYSTGPRTLWGGLGGGHNTPSNSHRPLGSGTTNVDQTDASKEGCILKLHKPSGGQHARNNACIVTMKHFCNTRKVRFKAYVWVDSGPLNFKFGPINAKGTISVPNLKVWTPVDVVITTNGSTGKYWRVILDTSSAQVIYIAMLGIYALGGSGNTTSSVNVE